jgi:FkbM family methyltransferase
MRFIANVRHRLTRYLDAFLGRAPDEDSNYPIDIRKYPMIFEDVLGIRFIRYPWDRRPVDRLLSRDFYKSELQAISRLVQAGNTVFDVGASIGLHSVFMSRLIAPAGRVYAFEPVPDTYWMLRETLALNRCESVIPFELAISDKVGTITMNVFDVQYCEYNTMGLPEMPSLQRGRVRPKTAVEVRCDTLDNFCDTKGIEKINLLKVDVEGFEKHVFVGGRKLLGEQRIKFISFEISQDPLKGAGIMPQEVFEVLESYGYQSYRFNLLTNAFEGPVRDSTEYYQVYFASWFNLSLLTTDEAGEVLNRYPQLP